MANRIPESKVFTQCSYCGVGHFHLIRNTDCWWKCDHCEETAFLPVWPDNERKQQTSDNVGGPQPC